MNASDNKRPINIIAYTGVPARNIPMAPPDLLECVPTSAEVNPNFSKTRRSTMTRMRWRTRDDGIV